jgi:hypothetical protein
MTLLEVVTIQLMCIVSLGAGEMDPEEVALTVQGLINRYPVPPNPAWRISATLNGCKHEPETLERLR